MEERVKLERLLHTFTGQERFPSELVLCNLADTKRRNSHLGSDVVDRDISAFDALVRKLTKSESGERWARVSGDEWLFFGADVQAFTQAALAEYALTQPYRAGWRCHATKDGEEKSAIEVVTTSLSRSARFVGAVVSSRGEVASVAAGLEAGVGHAPVATFVRLEDLSPPAPPRWCCIAEYPTRAYYCPFCEGTAFEWTDGDSSVYSGDGTCKTCHAEVSFSDAGGHED